MAKKRRIIQEQAEEEEITIDAEFDEKEFILGDMYGTKVLVAVFIMAIVSGIVFGLIQKFAFPGSDQRLIATAIGIILSIVIMYFMKEILRLFSFDADLLEAKTMIGNYIMYFLLTLGVWILVINF